MLQTAHAQTVEHVTPAKRKTQGVAPWRIYMLLGVTLAGFVAIVLLDVVFSQLIGRLNERLDNERSRVFIGELISQDLSRLNAGVYQMATTTGQRGQDRIFAQITETVGELQTALQVLKDGGEFVRKTRINIEDQSVMIRTYRYQRPEGEGYALESIDLPPKLNQFMSKVTALAEMLPVRDRLRMDKRNTDEYVEIIAQIKRELQTFPPVLIRMRENANRLFYESRLRLKEITTELEKRQATYQDTQLALTVLVIALVLVFGFWVLRNVAQSNRRLQDLARDLEFQKFAVDQHAIVSTTDIDGNIVYANDLFCKISGYSLEELCGQNHRVVKSDEHSDAFFADMWDTISSGQVWHGEIKNKSRNGEGYWVAATIVPVLDEKAEPFQYISIRTDITKRKKMEEDIAQAHNFLESITINMGEGVYVLNEAGECTFLNPEAEHLLGWKENELLGKNLHDIVHYQDGHGHLVLASECPTMLSIKKGHTYRSETEVFTRKNKEIFPVSIVSVPLREDGKITGSVAVFQDITERSRTARELAEAKEQAENANRAKSEFLSSMSHELRTPLNAILGFGQMLDFNPKEPLTDMQKSAVDQILKGGQHLLELINEVLDLAKIEAGKVDLSIENVSVAGLIDECLALVQTLAEKNDIELIVEESLKENVEVRADNIRFKQALLNLMSNAIKYNTPGGTVTLSGYATPGNMLHLSITDTGPGISVENQEALFQPFNRLGAEGTEIEGTGIGLTITKQLIERMDGHLGVESTLGEGATFWIELPLSEHNLADQISALGEGRLHVTLPEIQGSLLYVEDNPANLMLMEMVISQVEGLSMISAHNAELGIEMAINNKPDLVVMDINLPGMDGFEALRALQVTPETQNIPVIALSANAQPKDIEKGGEAGFLHYLTKPMKVDEMIEIIREILDAEIQTRDGMPGEPGKSSKPKAGCDDT